MRSAPRPRSVISTLRARCHFYLAPTDLWRETEVQQVTPRLAASCRFDVQCETPLAGERLALRRSGKSDTLNGETGALERLQGDVVLIVGNLSYDCSVDDRRADAPGRRLCSSSDAGGNQRAAQRRRGPQKTPAIQR